MGNTKGEKRTKEISLKEWRNRRWGHVAAAWGINVSFVQQWHKVYTAFFLSLIYKHLKVVGKQEGIYLEVNSQGRSWWDHNLLTKSEEIILRLLNGAGLHSGNSLDLCLPGDRSNLDWGTGCIDWSLSWDSSVPPIKYSDSALNCAMIASL